MRIAAPLVSNLNTSPLGMWMTVLYVSALLGARSSISAGPEDMFPVNAITNYVSYYEDNTIEKYRNDGRFDREYYGVLLTKLRGAGLTGAQAPDIAWNLVNWLDRDRVPQGYEEDPWWHTHGGEAVPLINEIVLEYDAVAQQATFKVELWFPFTGPDYIKVDRNEHAHDCDKFYFQAAIWDMPEPQTEAPQPDVAGRDFYGSSSIGTPPPSDLYEEHITLMEFPDAQWYVVELPPFPMREPLSSTNNLWFMAQVCVRHNSAVYPVDRAGGMKRNYMVWSGSSWQWRYPSDSVSPNYRPAAYDMAGAWGVDDPRTNGKGSEWHAESEATLGRNGTTPADWESGLNERQRPWGTPEGRWRQGIPIVCKDAPLESMSELGEIYFSNYFTPGSTGTWDTVDLMHATNGTAILDVLCDGDGVTGRTWAGLPLELVDPEYGNGSRLASLLTGVEIGFEGCGFHRARLSADDANQITSAILGIYRGGHQFTTFRELFSDSAGNALTNGGPIAAAFRQAATNAWCRDNAGVTNVELTAIHDLVLEGPIRGIIERGTRNVPVSFVSMSGSNVWPYASLETASTVLTDALAAVAPGGTVHVNDGSYTNVGFILDKPVTVEGLSGPERTIISLNGGGVVLSADSAVLDGLTLRDGSDAPPEYGGVIYCGPGSVVRKCIVTENEYHGQYNWPYDYNGGGGIYVASNGVVANCIVTKNRSRRDGGGIYIAPGGVVSNCVVAENSSDYGGGGIYCEGDGIVINSTLWGNEAHRWGGGSCHGLLYNCAIYANAGGGAHGGHLCNCTVYGNTNWGTRYSYLSNCIVYGNKAADGTTYNCEGTEGRVNYCCVSPLPIDGVGNIDADPLFCQPESGNFKLSPDSPCIDCGNDDYVAIPIDKRGNPRIQGLSVDMGAYESGLSGLCVDAARPDDSADGLSWPTAKRTIQAAIDCAREGDNVWVTNGVYAAIGVSNAAIIIRSASGCLATVIDGETVGRCATLGTQPGDTNTCLVGFTLRNGKADYGGGAYGGTLSNCILIDNTASGARFSAGAGGGAYGCALDNCTLWGNTATASGGGSYAGTLRNCIVWGNREVSGATNNYDDCAFQFSCTWPMPLETSNISADPLFNNPDGGDFRLRWGSPCIDAGYNSYVVGDVDALGRSRIVNGTVDMGACEHQQVTTATPVPVPYAWLAEFFNGLETDADFETAAYGNTDGDRDAAWQEYLAGSLPTNADSILTVAISVSNGTPIVTWSPDLGIARFYKVEGRTDMGDGDWEPANTSSRLFRVKVQMP